MTRRTIELPSTLTATLDYEYDRTGTVKSATVVLMFGSARIGTAPVSESGLARLSTDYYDGRLYEEVETEVLEEAVAELLKRLFGGFLTGFTVTT